MATFDSGFRFRLVDDQRVPVPADEQIDETIFKLVLVRNRLQCKLCQDIIESRDVHDFVSCSCRKVFIDGGREYCRWGGDVENVVKLFEWIVKPRKASGD